MFFCFFLYCNHLIASVHISCYHKQRRAKAAQALKVTVMASTLIQFITDDAEKMKSIQILEKLGLSLPDYLRMCMSRLNQENDIPFSIKLESIVNPGIRAMQEASKIAKQFGITDMTLDEINAEIDQTRKSK